MRATLRIEAPKFGRRRTDAMEREVAETIVEGLGADTSVLATNADGWPVWRRSPGRRSPARISTPQLMPVQTGAIVGLTAPLVKPQP